MIEPYITETGETPRVLVATPNYTNLVSAEVYKNHMECAVVWTKLGIHYKWLVTGRTFVHFARTQACQVALLLDMTHILWLDDDAVIDPMLLPKYLEFDKDIIVTPYFMRRPPFECGVLKSTTGNFHDHKTYRNLTIEELDHGLIEIDGGGTHAMLMKTAVLRTPGQNESGDSCDPKLKALLARLSPEDREIIDHNVGTLPDESFTMEQEDDQGIKPFFLMPKTGTEDMMFCYRAKRKGLKIWCDTDAQAGHVGFPPVITKAFREQAEVMIDTEKGVLPKAVVHRLKPNDISAGVPDTLGESSARHEALDMRKTVSLL